MASSESDSNPPFDNSGSGPLVVPGLNKLPIQAWLDAGDRFTHGVNEWHAEHLTVRELAMLRLMDALTDKLRWDRKILDEDIVSRWRAEAIAMPLISERAWDWCLKELRDKARLHQDTGRLATYDTGSRCVKSDVLVTQELRDELCADVAPLLAVPDSRKDWHPGSDGKVLNLVHPSLFPLVYGKTRVLAQGGRVDMADISASYGKGEVAPAHDESGSEFWSSRFQWLPCEVEFAGETGTDVRITSYINNLHPDRNRALYGTVEKLIGLSIPLWNDVLFTGSDGRTPPRIKTYEASREPEDQDWAQHHTLPEGVTDDKYPETMAKVRELFSIPDNPEPTYDYDSEEEDDDDVDEEEEEEESIDISSPNDASGQDDSEFARLERRLKAAPDETSFKDRLRHGIERKRKRIQRIVHPDPGVSFTYEEWRDGVQTPLSSFEPGAWSSRQDDERFSFQDVRLQDEFREVGLQVIVKLSSIELTPEKPSYPGGGWHLEGMLNEHIVATALYYYDVDNVTASRLSFRQETSLDELELSYEQDDHKPLATVFGLPSMRDEPAVQELGAVTTPQGRLLVFPNTLQHRVGPFALADPTRPGHRRFVALWLVDPHYRVCSTRNVPPQQNEWWWAGHALDEVRLGGLPAEVMEMVRREASDWPMGIEEARELRLELMAERTKMSTDVESGFENYNLCEH